MEPLPPCQELAYDIPHARCWFYGLAGLDLILVLRWGIQGLIAPHCLDDEHCRNIGGGVAATVVWLGPARSKARFCRWWLWNFSGGLLRLTARGCSQLTLPAAANYWRTVGGSSVVVNTRQLL
jgi:hypothetical protein